MIRVVYQVHDSEGRLRLRLPWLRKAPELGEPLADVLSRIDGMEEVRVRPYTGSILCLYDPGRCNLQPITEAIRDITGVEAFLHRGERSATEEAELIRAARDGGPALAQAVVTFFKGLNLEVLRATDARVDLGTLSALTFGVTGAVKVVSTGQLPLPPWFTLAWWAIRTFSTYEHPAIERQDSEPLAQQA